MLIAGAFVGFPLQHRWHRGNSGDRRRDGILCRPIACIKCAAGTSHRGESQKYPREYNEATEATAEALETGENPEVAEAGLSLGRFTRT